MFYYLQKHVIHSYFTIKILIYQARFHNSTTVVPEMWYFGYQTKISQCTPRISGTTYVVPVWYRNENTRVYVHLGTTVPNHLSTKHTKKY